jgi:DNA (cytosine-5)-methyltransferase 1
MLVAHALRGEGFDASEDGTGRGTPIAPVAFAQNIRDEVRLIGGDGAIAGALAAEAGMKQQTYLQQGWAVRHLTPTECARLQGFHDNHCRIPWRGKPAEECPDGPQYKGYGNSMSVGVIRWLGRRIEMVEGIL